MKKNIILIFFILFANFLFSQVIVKNNEQAKKALNKSGVYLNDLNFTASLQEAEKVLEFALKNNEYKLAAESYNLIGLNYEEFSEVVQAEKHYLQGVKFASMANSDETLSYLYNNIGNLHFFRLKSTEKGIYYYKKSLVLSKKIGNEKEITFAELNIADAYFEAKKFDVGFQYLGKIQNYINKTNDFEMSVSYYTLLGNYFSFKEKNTTAEKYFLKAITILKKNNVPFYKTHEMEIYNQVYLFYKKLDKKVLAKEYLLKKNNLEKELEANKSKVDLNKVKDPAEILSINNKIQKAESLQKLHEQEMENGALKQKFAIIFSAVLFVLLLIILKSYLENKKINKKLVQSNVELKLAQEKSEEATKMKSQFLSNVSHELRTPLYGVIGMAEILETEFSEIKNSQYFNALKFSSNYLLTLINDVLNVYRIEDSKFEFIYENVDIIKEIQTIKETLKVIGKTNNNIINVNISENIPVYIKTDLTRFSQILINLVSNSLKFTKNGTVTIQLELEDINKMPMLKLQVIDTGIGIPKEFLPKIFDKFVQVDVQLEEQYKGTGLGLSIVKKLVQLFKGDIKVSSELNKGTVFTVTLPYMKADQINVINLHEINVNIKAKKLNILIVEDNKINQMVTKKLLEKNKHTCTIAENGLDALKVLEKQVFDLILMDINMPVMNGFEASKEIRKNKNNTPIIALTASDKSEIINEVKNNGLNDILVKPFEIKQLELIINKYVN